MDKSVYFHVSGAGIRSSLFTSQTLDRESLCEKNMTCKMTLHGQDRYHSSDLFFEITILDINDNSPVLQIHDRSISESANLSSRFLIGTVRDSDVGQNDVQNCSIIDHGLPFNVIMADPDSKNVWNVYLEVTRPLDREVIPGYHMPIMATDGGSPPKTSTSSIYVQVTDSNDNAPFFTKSMYKANISVDALHEPFLTVSAIDADTDMNAHVTYSLNPIQSPPDLLRYIAVDKNSGNISLATIPPSAMIGSNFNVSVIAVDGGTPALSTSTLVEIHLLDEHNENPPQFTKQSYSTSISIHSPLNQPFMVVNASDMDNGRNAEVTYYLDTDQPHIIKYFAINDKTGEIYLTDTPPANLVESTIHLYVAAKDSGTFSLTSHVTVYVNVTDNRPPFFPVSHMSITIQKNAAIGTIISAVLALDSDAGEAGHTDLSIESGTGKPYFDIDSQSGIIRVKSSLNDIKLHSVTLTIESRDNGIPSLMSTTTVSIQLIDLSSPGIIG